MKESIVYNIDCLDIMAKYPDKYFDCCLTDPPYNVGLKYNMHDDNMINYFEWCNKWFNELLRISKLIVITVGMKNLNYWYNKNPIWTIAWIKLNQNSPSGLQGFNAWEPVLIFGKNKKRIGQDVINIPISIQKDVKNHPCPKSLKVWTKILQMFTENNDKIFDPFLGSGTTRISADKLGIDFIGCELDKDYFEAQEKRWKNYKAQLTFGDLE